MWNAIRSRLLPFAPVRIHTLPRSQILAVLSSVSRDLLERHGKSHEFRVYEQEGHGFRKEENRLDAARRTVAFFDKYLRVED